MRAALDALPPGTDRPPDATLAAATQLTEKQVRGALHAIDGALHATTAHAKSAALKRKANGETKQNKVGRLWAQKQSKLNGFPCAVAGCSKCYGSRIAYLRHLRKESQKSAEHKATEHKAAHLKETAKMGA